MRERRSLTVTKFYMILDRADGRKTLEQFVRRSNQKSANPQKLEGKSFLSHSIDRERNTRNPQPATERGAVDVLSHILRRDED